MIELRPASSLELGHLATLFTAAYEGYAVPFALDERTLAFMVEAYDLDLDASQVALLDGVPVALANLGIRGERGWIGGIGVIPFARRQGIAERLMRAVLDEGRIRGVRDFQLEVLEQNDAAIRLYEKLGFEHTRRLAVWVLDAAPDAQPPPAGTSVEAAHRVIRGLLPEREPWQRDDGTLARMRGLDPPLEAVALDGGAAIVRPTPQSVSVIQIAGDADASHALLAAIRARGALNVLNLPVGEPATEALERLGGRVAARQHELVLRL